MVQKSVCSRKEAALNSGSLGFWSEEPENIFQCDRKKREWPRWQGFLMILPVILIECTINVDWIKGSDDLVMLWAMLTCLQIQVVNCRAVVKPG